VIDPSDNILGDPNVTPARYGTGTPDARTVHVAPESVDLRTVKPPLPPATAYTVVVDEGADIT
jgi:hypothetical protein